MEEKIVKGDRGSVWVKNEFFLFSNFAFLGNLVDQIQKID